MKAAVVSYSLTGNNESLAKSLAERLPAEHIRITESKHRTMGTIAFDMLFKRTPKISMPAAKTDGCDLVIFVGPVWMGGVASPFRACFKELGPGLKKYAFVSISGGADGPNPKLAAELTRRLGKEPAALVEMHKADFLPREPKPTRDDTMKYQINDEQIRQLTDKAMFALAAAVGQPQGQAKG
jgi:flavodoxin